MTDILVRIKRLILQGRYAFSQKAGEETELDEVTELDVVEPITSAVAIFKRLRSTSVRRSQLREYLYVIQSTNLDGVMIYTKGKFVKESGLETFYFLVSTKRAMR